jgi:hypothetical protein
MNYSHSIKNDYGEDCMSLQGLRQYVILPFCTLMPFSVSPSRQIGISNVSESVKISGHWIRIRSVLLLSHL